jgi:hypothetical protein
MAETPPNRAVLALVKAAQDIPNPHTDSKNSAYKQDGKPYRYASLNAFLEVIKPVLTKHGLAVFQPISTDKVGGFIEIQTMFVHESGDQVTFPAYATPLTNGMSQQAIGGAVSYMRRYSLQSVLSLAADDLDAQEDTDERLARNQGSAPGNSGVTRQQSGNAGSRQQAQEGARTASKPVPTQTTPQAEERPTAAPSASKGGSEDRDALSDDEREVLGTVTYIKVDHGENKAGRPYTKLRFGVKPEDGGEVVYATTFDHIAQGVFTEAKDSGKPVRVTVRKGNFGWDMVNVAFASPVPEDADVPF